MRNWDNVPSKRKQRLRQAIAKRDGQYCIDCGVIKSLKGQDGLTIDHVVPLSRGGRSVLDNMVLRCRECNMKKGSRIY